MSYGCVATGVLLQGCISFSGKTIKRHRLNVPNWKSIFEEIPEGEELVAIAPPKQKVSKEKKASSVNNVNKVASVKGAEPKVAAKPKKTKTEKVQKKQTGKKKVEETLPPKKRGRPSKEEVAARDAKKLAEENRLKQELIARQQKQEVIKTDNAVVGSKNAFPIYLRGERVKEVFADGRIFNGTVIRQDIGSQYVLIRWDRIGSVQWHSAGSVSRTKALPVPDDEPSEEPTDSEEAA